MTILKCHLFRTPRATTLVSLDALYIGDGVVCWSRGIDSSHIACGFQEAPDNFTFILERCKIFDHTVQIYHLDWFINELDVQ